MLRYCTNCKSDFEVEPAAITSKKDLICPSCGNVVDKNSRRPSAIDGDIVSEGVGNFVSGVFRLAWLFYVTLSVIGFLCFFIHADTALYIVTAISLLAYFIQFISGNAVFTSGIVLLPLGALIGYFLIHGLQGACFGVLLVFFVRHILRDIIWALINRFISQCM